MQHIPKWMKRSYPTKNELIKYLKNLQHIQLHMSQKTLWHIDFYVSIDQLEILNKLKLIHYSKKVDKYDTIKITLKGNLYIWSLDKNLK
jgi:hypothetical protein